MAAAQAEALWQGLNVTQANGRTECVMLMCERSFTWPELPDACRPAS